MSEENDSVVTRWLEKYLAPVVLGVAGVMILVAIYDFRFEAVPSGGVHTPGAAPSDYLGAPIVEKPPSWAYRMTADLKRCLDEDHAGGVASPPCRFSCTLVAVDAGADSAHFVEAWFDPLPDAACDAWPHDTFPPRTKGR